MAILFFLIISLLPLPQITCTSTVVGVNYRTNTSPPDIVIAKLLELKVSYVRLPESNPKITGLFINTNISLLVTIPNTLINVISNDCDVGDAVDWINDNILAFYRKVNFYGISVGIDVFGDKDPNTSEGIVSALNCAKRLLLESGIRDIVVSTTLTYESILNCKFLPSSCYFKPVKYLTPLLRHLVSDDSPLFLDLNPYKLLKYKSQSEYPTIPLDFYTFSADNYDFFIHDPVTNKSYSNVFDIMFDNVIMAMEAYRFFNIPIVVVSTGWPTYDPSFDGALEGHSRNYLEGLVRHLRPGKRDLRLAFIEEFLDRNDSYRWGICSPDMSMKFDIDFNLNSTNTVNTTDIDLAAVYHASINGMIVLLTMFVAFVFVMLYNHHFVTPKIIKTDADKY